MRPRTLMRLAATALFTGALAHTPATAQEAPRPMNATPKQMLEGIVRAGVRTKVCALYLPNAGVGPEALIEGVRPAQPPEMARRMTDRATTVLPF